MRTYFSDCKTVQEVKAEYRKLAMKFHPDRGGDEKIMTAINAAYKKALERVATDAQKENGYGTAEHLDDGYMAVINQIIALDGVKIELCGLWIWLSGETKKHKETIKKAGFKWARKKAQWYWKPEWSKPVFKKREWTMDEIRERYGSVDLKNGNVPQLEQ